MRSPLSASVALTALLALTACGGEEEAAPSTASPSSSPSSSASPSEEAAPLLSEAELQARLLTLEDLPSGFVEAEPTDPAAEEEEPGLVSADPACQAYLDAEESEAPASAVAEFENPDTFEFITHDVESYEGDDAEASFSEARDALAACTTLTVEGAEGELTVQQQSFAADLGDETVAIRIDGEIDGGDGTLVPFGGQVVGVRVGNNVVSITIIAIGGQEVDTERVVRAAVEKFEAGASPGAAPSATATS